MRKNFEKYLKEKEKVKNNSVSYYFKWIDDCLSGLDKLFGDLVTNQEKDIF